MLRIIANAQDPIQVIYLGDGLFCFAMLIYGIVTTHYHIYLKLKNGKYERYQLLLCTYAIYKELPPEHFWHISFLSLGGCFEYECIIKATWVEKHKLTVIISVHICTSRGHFTHVGRSMKNLRPDKGNKLISGNNCGYPHVMSLHLGTLADNALHLQRVQVCVQCWTRIAFLNPISFWPTHPTTRAAIKDVHWNCSRGIRWGWMAILLTRTNMAKCPLITWNDHEAMHALPGQSVTLR